MRRVFAAWLVVFAVFVSATPQLQQGVLLSHGSMITTTPSRTRNTTRIDISLCPSGCSGHGSGCVRQVDVSSGAVEHRCVCASGYEGPECASLAVLPSPAPRERCPNNCTGRGLCRGSPMACECAPGYDGEDCSHVSSAGACATLSHCSGRGFCLYNQPSGTFSCVCDRGYGGADCGHVVLVCGLCRHGHCVVDDNDQASCQCRNGYGGVGCSEYHRDKDMCGSQLFCSGQGVCGVGHQPVLSAVLTPRDCACAPGFIGSFCDQIVPDACANSCSGHGTCNVGSKTCKCDIGWGGPGCAASQCPSLDGTVCSNHGVCEPSGLIGGAGKCVCDSGFLGARCDEKDFSVWLNCPQMCSGNAKACVTNNKGADYECVCQDGWTAVDCSMSRDQANEIAAQQEASAAVPQHVNLITADTLALSSVQQPTAELQASASATNVGVLPVPLSRGDQDQPIEVHQNLLEHRLDCCVETRGKRQCSDNGSCVKCNCECFPGYEGTFCNQQTEDADDVIS